MHAVTIVVILLLNTCSGTIAQPATSIMSTQLITDMDVTEDYTMPPSVSSVESPPASFRFTTKQVNQVAISYSAIIIITTAMHSVH